MSRKRTRESIENREIQFIISEIIEAPSSNGHKGVFLVNQAEGWVDIGYHQLPIPPSLPQTDLKISLTFTNTSSNMVVLSIDERSFDIARDLTYRDIVELRLALSLDSIRLQYSCTDSDHLLLHVLLKTSTTTTTQDSSTDSTPDHHHHYPQALVNWGFGDAPLPYWLQSDFYTHRPIADVHHHEESGTGKAAAERLLEAVSSAGGHDGDHQALIDLERQLISRGLVTKLRRYQLRGVLWLQRHMRHSVRLDPPEPVDRQRNSLGRLDGWMPLDASISTLHHGHQQCYYNLMSGEVRCERDIDRTVEVAGGILADFMGLGKSVQVLCLILLNSAPTTEDNANNTNNSSSGSDIPPLSDTHLPGLGLGSGTMRRTYGSTEIPEQLQIPCTCGFRTLIYDHVLTRCSLCGHLRHSSCVEEDSPCFACVCRVLEQSPCSSLACLLILPRGLISQWLGEARKHFGPTTLRIFVYEGVSGTLSSARTDPAAARTVDPRRLAQHDIVVVALDTLKAEVHLQSSLANEQMKTRSTRVYSRLISPLLCVDWNIVIVDETQRIEGEGNASKMAMRLPGRTRFVVSGTPLGSSSLDDLQYLLRFLRVPPFDDPSVWRALVSQPFIVDPNAAHDRLVFLLGQLMLRRRREDVAEELDATAQECLVELLDLSSFEQMQYDEFQRSVASQLQSSRAEDEVGKHLLENVEKLRRGCCHPEAFNKHGKHSPVSFDDIVISRAEKLALEIEEEQRKLLFSLASMAGCCLLKYDLLKTPISPSVPSTTTSTTSTTSASVIRADMQQRAVKVLRSAAEAYQLAVHTIERHRATTDLLAVGVLSDDTNNLVLLSKTTRADSIALSWRSRDLHSSYDTTAAAAAAAADDDDDDAFDSIRAVSVDAIKDSFQIVSELVQEPEPHDLSIPLMITPISLTETAVLPSSKVLDGTSFYAKVDFSSSKRVQEVIAQHGVKATTTLLKSLDATIVCLVLFPSLVTLVGGMTTRQISINMGLPLQRTVDSTRSSSSSAYPPLLASLTDCEVSVCAPEEGVRSKHFTATVQAFHSVGLLCYRDDAGELRVTVSLVSAASEVAARLGRPLEAACGLQLRLRGALYDVDLFQELHCRFNFVRALELLATEKVTAFSEPATSVSELDCTAVFHCEQPEPQHQVEVEVEVAMEVEGEGALLPMAGDHEDNAAAIDHRVIDPTSGGGVEGGASVATAEGVCAGVGTMDCASLVQAQTRGAELMRELFMRRAVNRRVMSGGDVGRVCERTEEKLLALSQIVGGEGRGGRGGGGVDRKWWHELLLPLVRESGSRPDYARLCAALIQDVRTSVRNGHLAYVNLSYLATVEQLVGVIDAKYAELHALRTALTGRLRDMRTQPSEEEILETSNCKKCCESHGKTGPVCAHCHLETRLRDYSNLLFAYRLRVKRMRMVRDDPRNSSYANKNNNIKNASTSSIGGGDIGVGSKDDDGDQFVMNEHLEHEVDGEVVMLLRELRKFINSSLHVSLMGGMDPDGVERIRRAARLEDEVCASMQAEVKQFNLLWANQQQLLFAYDDLHQAVSTVKLISPEQRLHGVSQHHSLGYITPYELPERYYADFVTAVQCWEELKGKLSKMKFMQYEDSCRRGGAGHLEERTCVICQCVLVSDIKLLPCLHSFHAECIDQWLPGRRKCPLCQAKVSMREVTSVENDAVRRGSQPQVKIVGDYGTKVNVLVGDLVRLTRESEDKAIVFSQWPEVLEKVVSAALRANNIQHACCLASKDLSTSSHYANKAKHISPFDRFKFNVNVRVLLIPLSLGSDGLSIIEANHIFLLEPLLNEATESQAIARIARIGQTKPTYVHKLILRKTIEEKIYRPLSTSQQQQQQQQQVQFVPEDERGINESTFGASSSNSHSITPSKRKSPMKSKAKACSEKSVISIDTLKRLFD